MGQGEVVDGHYYCRRCKRCLPTHILGGKRDKAQLTVRKLYDDLVRRLKILSTEHYRSAEAEPRAILDEALRPEETDFFEQAKKMKEQTRGRVQSDSTDRVRKDRDRSHRFNT